MLLGLGVPSAIAQGTVKPAGLHRIDPQTPDGLRTLFQPSSQPLPFVSAHRGGPQAGFPENCLATFEETLRHTYAVMEVDPRHTKDGAIVLHHDATLDRTTTGQGKVIDHTLAELKQLRLKGLDGRETLHVMPTLAEAIEWARGRTVLVLDQKDVPALERTRIITQHKAEAFVMVIAYSFADAKAVYQLNPNVMMEVMVPNRAKVEEFDRLGVPWKNVTAFVGHVPPEDRGLYEMIHERGGSCMIGTSRNLDRRYLTKEVTDLKPLEADYRAFLSRGADVIETDIPIPLGQLLQSGHTIPESKRPHLLAP
jgi:glycerophosphoryl diester phosphodiesterase